MKGIRTTIVLLVLVAGFMLASGPCDALAGEGPEYTLEDSHQYNDDLITSCGASDDGGSGDPGEAGDGYGVADQSNPLSQNDGGNSLVNVLEDAIFVVMTQIALLF